ncbi:MAG: alpha/beta hydrolase [Sinobacteraceae bacterium]|nr:alpha/beta hydrolase [Nevskiaceae bacterium]
MMRKLDSARPAGVRVAVAAFAAVALILCFTTTVLGAIAPEIPRRAVEPSTCPIVIAPAIAERTSCGRLIVPEDRRLPGGRTVAIDFVVVQAEKADTGREPLLFVMGGNGSSLKMLRRQSRLATHLSQHDTVIFVDHRGSTPWGRPDMSCPEYAEGLDAAVPGADPVKVAACRKHLEERLNVNLYGPYEAAEDLSDLRVALGISRWNVYGVSYGTTIAQRLLGIDSAGIGGIVLDGMSGIESNAFADSFLLDPLLDLIDECAASVICHSAFPSFEQQLGSVATELEQRPRRIGKEIVSNAEYLALIRYAMTDPDRRGRIPLAVARSASGDHRVWASLRLADEPQGSGGKDPAFTWPSSVCRDEHPRAKDPDRQTPARRVVPDAVRRGVRMVDGESWDWSIFCTRMGFERSAAETLVVPKSTVPALMLVGQLDLTTPKTWSDQVAQSMHDVRTVVFPKTTHFVLLRQLDCAAELMRSFYTDTKAPLDTRCVESLPKTDWAIDAAGKPRR